MNDLIKFADVWEKTGNIEDLLAQNLVLPPSEDVQAFLSTLSQAEHDRIRKSLTDAITALSTHTSRMEVEAQALKDQIDQNIQASNACLVYTRTPQK